MSSLHMTLSLIKLNSIYRIKLIKYIFINYNFIHMTNYVILFTS